MEKGRVVNTPTPRVQEVQATTPPCASCVALGKTQHLSEPQLPPGGRCEDAVLAPATTWAKLEGIMLGEISQTHQEETRVAPLTGSA